MSRSDIFGGKEFVTVDKEVERDGILGSTLDKLIGKKTIRTVEEKHHRGMPIKTFLLYFQMWQHEIEKREKNMKRERMKQKFKRGI